MALSSDVFDEHYFDGLLYPPTHPAGYDEYKRIEIYDDEWAQGESLGEYWGDYARKLYIRLDLNGKKVLDLGCAKGFLVEDLRTLEVEAYGVDVSEYALSQVAADIRQYCMQRNIITYLSQIASGQYDVIIGLQFLSIFSDAQVQFIVNQCARIATLLYFTNDYETIAEAYYTKRTPQQWANAITFPDGTILVNHNTQQEYVVQRGKFD